MWRTVWRHPGQLRKRFAKQVDQLARTATAPDGEVSEEGIAEAERLERLYRLVERRRRRLVSTGWFACFALIALVGVVRVPSTDITLEVVSNLVSFRLQEQLALVRSATLTTMDASAVLRVELPPTGTGEGYRADPAPGDSFTIQIDQELSPPEAAFSLSGVHLAGGTIFSIDRTDESTSVYLRLMTDAVHQEQAAARPVELSLGVTGQLLLRSSGAPVSCLFEQPSEIAITLAAPPLQLSLIPLLPTSIELASNFSVDELSFFDRHDALPDLGGDAYLVSQIREGELIIEDIKGAAGRYTLRAFEPLTLHGVDGVVQLVELTEDGVKTCFRGTVAGLTTGAGTHRRDLMPTWIESLQASRPQYLVWYCLALLVTLLQNIRQLTRG
jgi:hypothetical protein